MTITGSWIAYSEKMFRKAQAAEDELIARGPTIPAPKPHYAKGDTTAATNRLAQLRLAESQKEKLGLKVARELITPLEEQAARFRPRFQAAVESILARPFQPALPGERPNSRPPAIALIEPNDWRLAQMAISPAAAAVMAVCGCRWPVGEPEDAGFHFCNKKRTAHFYCEAHARKSRK